MCDCNVPIDKVKLSFKKLLLAHEQLQAGYHIFLFCDICKQSQDEPPNARYCSKCWKEICSNCDNIQDRTNFVYQCQQEIKAEKEHEDLINSIQTLF